MEKLSPELLHIVLSNLSGDGLSRYCTVSRQWQIAIEQTTFRRLLVRSDEIDFFKRSMCRDGSRRVDVLRKLSLSVEPSTHLHAVDDEERDRIDSSSTSRDFTKIVKDFFEALNAISSGQKHDHSHGVFLNVWERSVELDGRDEDNGVSLLRLDDKALFPNRLITGFCASYSLNNVMMDPASCIEMIAACTGIETCRVIFYDEDPWESLDNAWGREVRMDFRSRLTAALGALSSSHLRELELDSRHKETQDEHLAPDNIVIKSTAADPYSTSLRDISQSFRNLTTIRLLGAHTISPTLFWPEQASCSPNWPQLRILEVKMHTATPDGDWYFEAASDAQAQMEQIPDRFDFHDSEALSDGNHDNEDDDADDENDGEDDDDDRSTDTEDEVDALIGGGVSERRSSFPPRRQFRTVPSKRMLPLLVAMARAARAMPVIQQLSLSCANPLQKLVDESKPVSAPGRHSVRQFAVYYRTKGSKAWDTVDSDCTHVNRLIWCVGNWRPGKEVLDEWQSTLGDHGVFMFENLLDAKYQYS